MFYALIVLYVFRYAAKATNLKLCLRLTEMYSKVLHSQHIQYHTARIQRHYHHKEHTEVKKQSILRYLLGGGD